MNDIENMDLSKVKAGVFQQGSIQAIVAIEHDDIAMQILFGDTELNFECEDAENMIVLMNKICAKVASWHKENTQ